MNKSQQDIARLSSLGFKVAHFSEQAVPNVEDRIWALSAALTRSMMRVPEEKREEAIQRHILTLRSAMEYVDTAFKQCVPDGRA